MMLPLKIVGPIVATDLMKGIIDDGSGPRAMTREEFERYSTSNPIYVGDPGDPEDLAECLRAEAELRAKFLAKD
jgi:hypothetical protein